MPKTLAPALAYLRRDDWIFFALFFGIFIGVTLVITVALATYGSGTQVYLNGLVFGAIFASFVSAWAVFEDNFRFLLANGMERRDIGLAMVLDGLFFSLVFSLLLALSQALLSLLSFLDIQIVIGATGVSSLLLEIVWTWARIFSAYVTGLVLAAFFSQVEARGKIAFVIFLLGLIMLFGWPLGLFFMGMANFPGGSVAYGGLVLLGVLLPPLFLALLMPRLHVNYPQ